MNPVIADTVMDTDTILPARIAVTQYFLTAVRVSDINDKELNLVYWNSP
jgi:hypothetical protein